MWRFGNAQGTDRKRPGVAAGRSEIGCCGRAGRYPLTTFLDVPCERGASAPEPRVDVGHDMIRLHLDLVGKLRVFASVGALLPAAPTSGIARIP